MFFVCLSLKTYFHYKRFFFLFFSILFTCLFKKSSVMLYDIFKLVVKEIRKKRLLSSKIYFNFILFII